MPELESSPGTPFHRDDDLVLPEPGSILDHDLDLEGCGAVTALPDHLTVNGNLRLRGTRLTRLPAFLTVRGSVELEGVETLTEIGDHTRIDGNLDLEECSNLKFLPDHLTVNGDIFLAGTGVRIVPIDNRISGQVHNLT